MSTRTTEVLVRTALADDLTAIARFHVRAWQQTYRGLMADEVLDDPGFVPARERMWRAVLTDSRFATHRAAVAEKDGDVVGLALSGPPQDDDARWPLHLYVLYLDAAHHGTGAGGDLLDTVVGPHEAAALWVAEPNPRAQAFYRKHGFVPDGAATVEDGLTEVRMVRSARRAGVPPLEDPHGVEGQPP